MSYLPYQERVIAEKAELDEKIQKLEQFLETNPGHVSDEDKTLLSWQRGAMSDYSAALGQRIRTFVPVEPAVPTLIAKFEVRSVVFNASPSVSNCYEELTFAAVCGKPFDKDGVSEDNSFSRWTPSGELKMTVTNPSLFGKIKVGEKYYVRLTRASA